MSCVNRFLCWSASAALLCGLAGCAVQNEPVVSGPLFVPPVAPHAAIERLPTGSLFQPQVDALFTGRRKPASIGEVLKVDISETLSASQTVKSNLGRETALASKGPGNASEGALLKDLLNQNISASGNSSFKGSGSAQNDSSFNGQIATSVINVLANGNLVVAGERAIALNGNRSTLRFSGVVDPHDIKDGNVVQSRDVVNARVEVLGQGDLADGSSRHWLQRILNNSLSIW
jgi:flagellar L-ring protein FlgH